MHAPRSTFAYLFTPPKMAPHESKRFGQKNYTNTGSSHKRGTFKSTIGTHFIIFEMALGPLWHFVVPNLVDAETRAAWNSSTSSSRIPASEH